MQGGSAAYASVAEHQRFDATVVGVHGHDDFALRLVDRPLGAPRTCVTKGVSLNPPIGFRRLTHGSLHQIGRNGCSHLS